MQYNNEVIVSTDVKVLVQNGVWFNATNMVDGFNKENGTNKRLDKFWENSETIEYVEDLVKELNNSNSPSEGELKTELYKQAKGGRYGGTYIHPELAVVLARYLSPKFGRACDKVVQKVMKYGYFITEEAKANPSQELIKEATSILTTRLGIDNTRDELIEYINQYLVDENWNTHSLPNALSSVYQHIHIAQRGMVASQILEEEFKSLKTSDMEITNHRQKRKLPAVYSSDYLVAQNYYSEKEVTAFNKRLNFILSRVKTHIEFKPKQLSPQSVIALLKKASRDMVYETSEQVFGTTYKGKNAKQLRKALYGFVEGSVEFEEALVLIDEVGDGNTFTLGKS